MSNPFNNYLGSLPVELRNALASEIDPVGDEAEADVDDASTTVKGVVKLSTAPVSAAAPIAVGDNDPRLPTTGQKAALAGSAGTPSADNAYVTEEDTVLDNLAHTNATQTFTGAQGSAAVVLTDAANIATNAALGNVFTVTLTDNRTLDNPTNLVAGFTYIWIVTQDAGGTNTLAYGNLFAWPGGTAPTITATGNAVSIITGVYDGTLLHCNAALASAVPA